MAKTRSGLGLIDFGKVISFQYANQEGFNSLAPVVTIWLTWRTNRSCRNSSSKKNNQLTIENRL